MQDATSAAAGGGARRTRGPAGRDRNHSRAPYLEALVDYARRRPGRFHIPGHKGGAGADPALVEALGPAALDRDIPSLIEGIDVGPEPTPFQEAQRLAADAWGARRSWFLINGASQGNHAACLALRQAGRRVVVQRNVHSSTIDGLILAGLEPTFVAPEVDPDLGIAHCITPESLAAALDRARDALAAFVVSPTYFGAVADLRELARVAHERSAALVVDEAWGAHLRFSSRLPDSALACGADLVLNSTHKIVGSLTQSAILHLGHGGLIDENLVDRGVTLVESTSPSALLSGSLDAARRWAVLRGEELLSMTIDALAAARDEVRSIAGLEALEEGVGERPGVHGWDPLRFAVDVRGTGATGHRLAVLLRELDDINLELAVENVIVAVFGLGEDASASAPRLTAALRHAVAALGETGAPRSRPFASPPPWGRLEMPPRDAFLAAQRVVPFEHARGRVAAESLATYPPGIPNVLPGELLTTETLAYISDTIRGGGKVRGAADRSLRTIRVVAE
jgi:arginine/lysine/ornithine decarboxylase